MSGETMVMGDSATTMSRLPRSWREMVASGLSSTRIVAPLARAYSMPRFIPPPKPTLLSGATRSQPRERVRLRIRLCSSSSVELSTTTTSDSGAWVETAPRLRDRRSEEL